MVGDELLFLDEDLAVLSAPGWMWPAASSSSLPRWGCWPTCPAVSRCAPTPVKPAAPSFIELYVVQGAMLPNETLRPERALTGDLGLGWKRGWGVLGDGLCLTL